MGLLTPKGNKNDKSAKGAKQAPKESNFIPKAGKGGNFVKKPSLPGSRRGS
jgi:hypothetical protein